jgi:hypothetical protein
MTSVLARIGLRYAAAALITRGLLSPDDGATIMNDPDVQLVVGAGLGVLSEGWYWLAHRFGWAK